MLSGLSERSVLSADPLVLPPVVASMVVPRGVAVVSAAVWPEGDELGVSWVV